MWKPLLYGVPLGVAVSVVVLYLLLGNCEHYEYTVLEPLCSVYEVQWPPGGRNCVLIDENGEETGSVFLPDVPDCCEIPIIEPAHPYEERTIDLQAIDESLRSELDFVNAVQNVIDADPYSTKEDQEELDAVGKKLRRELAMIDTLEQFHGWNDQQLDGLYKVMQLVPEDHIATCGKCGKTHPVVFKCCGDYWYPEKQD